MMMMMAIMLNNISRQTAAATAMMMITTTTNYSIESNRRFLCCKFLKPTSQPKEGSIKLRNFTNFLVS